MSAALELLDPPKPSLSPLALAEQVENGLPIAALDELARTLAPDDPNFVYRLVPRATLARRRAHPGARLTVDESARVTRLAAVWSLAKQVWKDDDAARRFLFKPHMLLDGRRSIDVVLGSEFGRPAVEQILGGLLYGTGI